MRDRFSFSYDPFLDLLYLRFFSTSIYEQTLDLSGVLIDISKNQDLRGIEILDASKVFDVEKSDLKEIKSLNVLFKITEENIDLNLTLNVSKNDKICPLSLKLSEINDYDLFKKTVEFSASYRFSE
ncbi:DUF2283 domain-containing protein [Methanococcus maripaludis]|uniref:Uncharacterized protein n=1 Tax=Methanococcus maripaludis (strain DSM 14266 / JCM 13030 / NBRC 101832 / S2 / LL) TaxID=267377 RepID=Q6LZZ5_METMP|nr:DUF2283 domain-containing protein [Methanococcus maripaludis]CAF30034.1 conserved hypothetical protein [Methanococcus maripaludis S2]